jgi:hypothetical protein
VVTDDLKLTRTHAFFMIMGGFHYFEGSDKEDTPYKAAYPLRYQDVISMLDDETISLPLEEELRDKSKSPWLIKTIVLLQAFWFIAQCIARGIEKLPITELEIVTLAYMFINVCMFIAWQDKPRNVDHPIRVSQKPTRQDSVESVEPVEGWTKVFLVIAGSQDTLVELHKRTKVPMFYSGDPDGEVGIANLITLAAGVVFGAIHCIAWSFDFGSHTELLLWRLSSIAITAAPVLFVLTLAVAAQLVVDQGPLRNPYLEIIACLVFCLVASLILVLLPLLALLYIAARLTTPVLAFMNLASLPPGAFQAVYWTTLIPHL